MLAEACITHGFGRQRVHIISYDCPKTARIQTPTEGVKWRGVIFLKFYKLILSVERNVRTAAVAIEIIEEVVEAVVERIFIIELQRGEDRKPRT